MTTFSGTVVVGSGIDQFGQDTIFDFRTFDVAEQVYLPEEEPEENINPNVSFIVIDPVVDFDFTPSTTVSGLTVVTFGFGINAPFVVPSYVNQRFFPVAIELSTLFPGDVPRGEPLN